jgi:hypothetical protein
MKTPAGKECPHYYGNFKRGMNQQECRLAEENPESGKWHPNDCSNCPVPEIVHANASPHLQLRLTIKPGFLGLAPFRRLIVEARCGKHNIKIDDPMVGCPQCNAERPGFESFLQTLEGGDS